MLETGARITARRPGEWIARLLLGVPVLTETNLVAIHGGANVEGLEIERAGQRKIIACDGVVFTGQFRPETAVLATSHLKSDPGTGGPAIDQYWRASDPSYFVAGNLLRPVETADAAVEEEIVRELTAHPPDRVLLVSRDVREYGSRGFGIDYDLRVAGLLRARYRVEQVWHGERFEAVLFRNAEARHW